MSKQKFDQEKSAILSAEDRKVNRRRFMTSFAVGAGLAPLASVLGSKATAWGGDAVNDLCYGSPAPITQADLRYAGALRVPATGVRLDYGYGSLTGRRVNGEVRLFLGGHVQLGSPIAELGIDQAPSANQLGAPRIRLVNNWGNVTGGKKVSWDQNGTLRTNLLMANLHWSERNQLLYWTYYDTYNVAQIPDWSLAASRLNADGSTTAFGPWRTFGEGRYGSWRTINLGEHPDGSMLCGSRLQSGNAGSPWGPDLWRGQFPTANTPAGLGSPDIQLSKYVTYYLQAVSTNGSFSNPIRACRRPGTYIFEPTANANKTEIDPTKNGGTGSWTSLDLINGLTWIDLPDKRGVIFSGRFATGHVWYSNAGAGYGSCTHGFPAAQGITGPVATGAHPILALYDISDLEAVAGGRMTDYTVQPTFVNAEQAFGCKTAAINREGTFGNFGGSYFDPVARRLYVLAPEADDTLGVVNLLPLIHVWDIV